MKKSDLIRLEQKLLTNNPYSIYDEFYTIFDNSRDMFPIRLIEKDKAFYRARIGKMEVPGSIDDHDTHFSVAFFGNNITAFPPIFAKGGRFNREGHSFLYLSSNIETCMAELRAEVNQICSVGILTSNCESIFIDFTQEFENETLQYLKHLLLDPVHSEIKHRYLISQFISDIFRKMNYQGIVYNSTVSSGENLVCFNVNDFSFKPFSENMYKTTKVQYSISKIDDSYKKYYRYRDLMGHDNVKEEEKREEIFDYLRDKINYEIKLEIADFINRV